MVTFGKVKRSLSTNRPAAGPRTEDNLRGMFALRHHGPLGFMEAFHHRVGDILLDRGEQVVDGDTPMPLAQVAQQTRGKAPMSVSLIGLLVGITGTQDIAPRAVPKPVEIVLRERI